MPLKSSQVFEPGLEKAESLRSGELLQKEIMFKPEVMVHSIPRALSKASQKKKTKQ